MKLSKPVKATLLGIVISTAVYVGTYIALSFFGGYYFNQSGKVRYRSMGLSVSDISTWNPKGCWYQAEFKNTKGISVSRGNDLGYLFSPLIILDRKYFHPTVILIKPKNPDETYWFPL
ncbi:hypothetical protein [uncultured Gimesia sp.]|uniref:hypothetical protein n=1 Tax=uncultured Gimesia sp. TaxID=1678688 RepID=UPI00260A4361|nr:hypothetical protein [uncultured Gimesia sp.]